MSKIFSHVPRVRLRLRAFFLPVRATVSFCCLHIFSPTWWFDTDMSSTRYNFPMLPLPYEWSVYVFLLLRRGCPPSFSSPLLVASVAIDNHEPTQRVAAAVAAAAAWCCRTPPRAVTLLQQTLVSHASLVIRTHLFARVDVG